jgi:hypothetical protein
MTLARRRRGFGLAGERSATPAIQLREEIKSRISLDTKLVVRSEGWRDESEAMPLVMKISSH